ncbi:MAG: hypothetical protein DRJ59_06890 [Thermoprotei archaeon]|nr:MAG: hypothetical protein DRJ59_06890 [Thermoprotei archaeon]
MLIERFRLSRKSYLKYRNGISKLEAVLLIALIAVSLFACYAWLVKRTLTSTQAPPKTITIVDSSGKYVTIPWPLKRIVALSSDSAQVLIALGAKETIVGLTKYAIGKPWAPKVPEVGSCFKPNIEAIVATKPNAVITYVRYPKPEALEEKLEPLGIKVVRLDFYKIETFFAEVKLLGLLVNRTERAEELVKYWKGIIDMIKERVKGLKPEERVRVYFEGYHDYHAAGPGTGWDELLRLAGGINIFADSPIPYPKVSLEAVIERNPDVIIKAISSTKFKAYGATDPKPLKELWEKIVTRPGWSEIKAVKNGKVYLICADHLHSSFGLVAELAYIAKLLYPGLFKDLDPISIHRKYLEDILGVKYVGIWIYPTG